VHADALVHRTLELSAQGLSDYAIARAIEVPRATVRNWRVQGGRSRTDRARAWVTADTAYPYLLGQYLGDGHISATSGRSAVLAITVCDSYPSIAGEVTRALHAVFPGANLRRVQRPHGACSVLAMSHPAVLSAFPQHGPGKKHHRRIELVEWQRVLTHRYPEAFIRGLIHSDGSRCINQVNTALPSGRHAHYEYVRYFFTNYSEDIRRIFCEHCELLDIRWTQSNPRNISISHRDSTAILDRIVGPKT
jgi:hypothetical protein